MNSHTGAKIIAIAVKSNNGVIVGVNDIGEIKYWSVVLRRWQDHE